MNLLAIPIEDFVELALIIFDVDPQQVRQTNQCLTARDLLALENHVFVNPLELAAKVTNLRHCFFPCSKVQFEPDLVHRITPLLWRQETHVALQAKAEGGKK